MANTKNYRKKNQLENNSNIPPQDNRNTPPTLNHLRKRILLWILGCWNVLRSRRSRLTYCFHSVVLLELCQKASVTIWGAWNPNLSQKKAELISSNSNNIHNIVYMCMHLSCDFLHPNTYTLLQPLTRQTNNLCKPYINNNTAPIQISLQ